MKTAVLLVIQSDGDTIMASIRGHFERCGGTIVNHLVIQHCCNNSFKKHVGPLSKLTMIFERIA